MIAGQLYLGFPRRVLLFAKIIPPNPPFFRPRRASPSQKRSGTSGPDARPGHPRSAPLAAGPAPGSLSAAALAPAGPSYQKAPLSASRLPHRAGIARTCFLSDDPAGFNFVPKDFRNVKTPSENAAVIYPRFFPPEFRAGTFPFRDPYGTFDAPFCTGFAPFCTTEFRPFRGSAVPGRSPLGP